MCMKYVRYWMIRVADWFDDRILKHRIRSICCIVGTSNWWDAGGYEKVAGPNKKGSS